jgi:hypothetical protein
MLKKVFYILFINCTLLTANCFTQSITWQKIYDGPASRNDDALDVCESTDGHFYVVGSTFVMGIGERIYVLKLNQFGDTLWTRIISPPGAIAYAVASTNDGGCVLTGSGNAAFTIKVNANGTLGWQNIYNSTSCFLYDIKQTLDGGYIACGKLNTINNDGYIIKIDSLGNLQWQKIYLSSYSKPLNSITEALDGGFISVGSVLDNPQDTTKAYILKIDTNGNEDWEKRFKINNRSTGCSSISQIEGGYLVGGNTRLYSTVIYQPYFVRLSLAGDTIFTQTYSDTNYLYQIKPINSNRYVVALSKDTAFIPYTIKARTLITDSIGTIIHENFFFNGKYDELTMVLPLSNGDIIFSGYTEPPTNQFTDIYIVRTDSNLNSPPIAIEPIGNLVPSSSMLFQNYPNPFNPSTLIKFDIGSYVQSAKLIIYDILGRQIEVLLDQSLKSGTYVIKWTPKVLTSGVYNYVLYVDQKSFARKMIFVK